MSGQVINDELFFVGDFNPYTINNTGEAWVYADPNNLGFDPKVNFLDQDLLDSEGFPLGERVSVTAGDSLDVEAISPGSFFIEVNGELSPNNTLATAESLGILTPGIDNGRFGMVGNSDRDDFYSFTLDTPSSVQVTLQGLTADADIEILDSSGNTVDNGTGTNSGNTSENLQLELPAGNYFAHINLFGDIPTEYDFVLIPTPTTSNSDSDTVSGGNDSDTVSEGNDSDTVSGGNDSDTVSEGNDSDTVSGGNDSDTVSGGNGNTDPTVVSFTTPSPEITDPGNPVGGVTENGENTIDGQVEWLFSNGPDNGTVPVGYTRVKALSGNDNITGQSVPEWFNGNQGNDTVNGAGGTDTIFGGQGSDNLNGDTEGDQMFGNLNNDVLTGGDGNDTIFGGQGDDIISGGAGDDVLFGDKGQDQLTGGPGNDIFALPGSAAAATTLSQADVIMDYGTGNDSLMLPTGVVESQLTFSSVNLQVDGGSAEASTAIELNGTFLGIVKGVTSQSDLNFVAFDSSVIPSS